MKTHYRSVWISDVHLCTRDAQAEMLYSFLDSVRCDHLYLVGDIIDMWALKRKWRWPREYNAIIHKILKRSRKGARVVFIPGNHDDFFRDFVGYRFGDVEVASHAEHVTADGRRFLVMHGDEFDAVVQYHAWLSHLGSWAYQRLILLNRVVNLARRWMGMPYWSLSGAIKRRVKKAATFATRFEETLIQEARRRGVDGVICGHIHQPVMREEVGLLYCNTGDWIENCTALVEECDGSLRILRWHDEIKRRVVATPPMTDHRPAPASAAYRPHAWAGDRDVDESLEPAVGA